MYFFRSKQTLQKDHLRKTLKKRLDVNVLLLTNPLGGNIDYATVSRATFPVLNRRKTVGVPAETLANALARAEASLGESRSC